MGHCAPENEPPRLYARHLVDAHTRVGLNEFVDGAAQSPRISEQGGDIAKHDAGSWIVRDRADDSLEVHRKTSRAETPLHKEFWTETKAGCGQSPYAFSTRPATASSLASIAGSRMAGAVMHAVSRTFSMPSGDGERLGPSFGAR